jgi:hypothetical protein
VTGLLENVLDNTAYKEMGKEDWPYGKEILREVLGHSKGKL